MDDNRRRYLPAPRFPRKASYGNLILQGPILDSALDGGTLSSGLLLDRDDKPGPRVAQASHQGILSAMVTGDDEPSGRQDPDCLESMRNSWCTRKPYAIR